MAKTADPTGPRGNQPPELESQPFLDTLPELDAPLAARRLRERLDALARIEAEPGARFATLNALDSRVAAVAATLAGRHITLTLPLSDRVVDELELIRQLHQARARAWSRVAHDFPDKGTQQLPRRQRELQGKARLHALLALTDALLSSQRYYRDPPRGLWREIHQAYWRGVYPDTAGKPKHPEEQHAEASYVRALLLGLCGAEQLPYRTVDRVALALERDWKLDAMITGPSATGDAAHPRGRFLIDPASDRAATPCLSGIRLRPQDQILNTVPLITQLRERFENLVRELAKGTEQGKLPPDFGELELLRTLIGKWGGGALRRHTRTPIRTPGSILGGLSRIFQALSISGDEASGAEIVLSAADVVGNPFLQESMPSASTPARWMEISLEDQSDEGLRIRIERQTGTYLTVGDLVCTRHTERVAGAEFGVIVRARALAADEVEFGIRRLGIGRDSARIYLVGKDTSPSDIENLGTPFRALILQPAKTGPELIIADKGLYRPGAMMWAIWGGETRVIRSGALALSTRNFDAFAFSSAVSAGHTQGPFVKPTKRSSGTGGDQGAVI